MNNIFDKQISVFTNAFHISPDGVYPIHYFLNPPEQVRLSVQSVRDEQEKTVRNDLKKLLPAATISGVFSSRSLRGLIEYNGIICLDFDQADNPDWTPDTIKEHLAAIPEVGYAGTSCSGGGVFALIQTNNTNPALHGRIVDFLRACFLQDGLQIDVSCKDVCRLRFVSYDPDPLINPMPEVYDAVAYIERANRNATQPRPASGQHNAGLRLEKYVECLEGRRVDITNAYEKWVLVGLALASELGTAGETIFQRVSQFHPKYDPVATAKKYAELCRSGSGRVTIATFYKFCHEAGIRL